jgi:putative copper resistance protein D
MGMPVADVDRESLGWYLFETSAGRAAMARGALLIAMVCVLGWHRRRGKVESAFPLAATLAGGALASLAWNGHAAAGEGVAGAVRLVAGFVHLLAAGGWIAAVLMFLGMLLRRKEASGSGRLRSTHDFLHGFSTLGTIFVAALIVSGIAHYGDLTAWSLSTLVQSTYGNLLLFKLALFGGMLGLGALHRWTLVPRLGRALTSGDPAQEVRALRQSVAAEAALATLILIVVAVLGTLSPV